MQTLGERQENTSGICHDRERLHRETGTPVWHSQAKGNKGRLKPYRCSALDHPPIPPAVKFGAYVHHNITYQDVRKVFKILYKHKRLRPALNKPKWNKKSKPWEVMNYMLELYESMLPQGVQWHVEDDYILNQFVYNDIHNLNMMPLCFLEGLKPVNEKLHDIILSCARMIFHECGLAAWEEECESYVEWFIERGYEDEEDKTAIELAIDIYKGVALNYLMEIHVKLDAAQFELLLAQYTPESELEKDWVEWMKRAIDVCKEHTLSQFEVEEFDDCELAPCQYVRFMWDADDYMSNEVVEAYNDTAGNCGVSMLQFFQVVRHDNDEFADEFKITEWPYQLVGLMNDGYDLAGKTYG